MIAYLAHYLRHHGPIRSARVSSAQAKGNAKKYAYWGAVRYVVRLDRNGRPINVAMGRAGSDRRSLRLAERDCETLCEEEGRVRCDNIGKLDDVNCLHVLGQIDDPQVRAAIQRHLSRRSIEPRALTLSERLMVHCLMRDSRPGRGRNRRAVEADVRSGKFQRQGRWIRHRDRYDDVTYVPHGDDRDAAVFAAETNQELRRKIHAVCGDRVLDAYVWRLVQADDYGQLHRNVVTDEQQVRVVCPSTGAVYWLPVSMWCRTAHAAVAETFGMDAAEYTLTSEA